MPEKKVPVDLQFRDLKVYGVSKFTFGVGDVVQLSIEVPAGTKLRWFSDNDQVLEVLVDETTHSALVTALAIGESSLTIAKNKMKKPFLEIPITVVEKGPLVPASNLRAEFMSHVPQS